MTGNGEFTGQLADDAAAVERILDTLLPQPGDGRGAQNKLFEAIRYGVFGGGKRFRPFLTLNTARLFDTPPSQALRVAAAVECAHAYSLMHDDLPCMDDDDMRHGQPAVHRRYGEAVAVLAGNALLALAFEVLADTQTHTEPGVRCALVAGLAVACGGRGMMGGQMLDIARPAHADEAHVQALKTGALMGFACEAGAIAGVAGADSCVRLRAFGAGLGRAFQITDDRLDAEGQTPYDHAVRLAREAMVHLEVFGPRADILRAAAHFAIMRDT